MTQFRRVDGFREEFFIRLGVFLHLVFVKTFKTIQKQVESVMVLHNPFRICLIG